MRYKAGDKVWAIVDARYTTPHIVQILGAGRHAAVVLRDASYDKTTIIRWMLHQGAVYQIDMEGYPSAICFAAEKVLEPCHDPYEGDQAGSWDTCPYQPERVLV